MQVMFIATREQFEHAQLVLAAVLKYLQYECSPLRWMRSNKLKWSEEVKGLEAVMEMGSDLTGTP